MWLTGMNNPDHNSLWRFWNDNKQALKEVFRQTVRVAMDAGLVDMVLNAVDGTKIAARASTDKAWFQKKLKKRVERLDLWLDQAMKEVDRAEKEESGEYRLPEELAEKQKLREAIQESLTQLKAKQRESMHPGEPDAQMMKTREGTRLGYNAQAVVDSKAGVIVAGEVTTDQNDTHQLVPMLEMVQKELGRVQRKRQPMAATFPGNNWTKRIKPPCRVSQSGPSAKSGRTVAPITVEVRVRSRKRLLPLPHGAETQIRRKHKRENKTHEMRAYGCKNASQCPVRWDCSKDKKGGV